MFYIDSRITPRVGDIIEMVEPGPYADRIRAGEKATVKKVEGPLITVEEEQRGRRAFGIGGTYPYRWKLVARTFQAGDVVRCVVGYDHPDAVKVGTMLEVKAVDQYYRSLDARVPDQVLIFRGPAALAHAYRFEPVPDDVAEEFREKAKEAEFSPGDLVRCVDAEYSDLIEGGIYKVKRVDDYVHIADPYPGGGWWKDRFVKLTPEEVAEHLEKQRRNEEVTVTFTLKKHEAEAVALVLTGPLADALTYAARS